MTQESFRNWQARSIEQKQNTSALMIGLSGGALGFSASLLSSETSYIGCTQAVLFHAHSILQLLTIASGVLFSFNRVRDFELTAQIARLREENNKAPALKLMREKVRCWGRITRRLFLLQGVSFIVGALSFVVFIACRYSHILYR